MDREFKSAFWILGTLLIVSTLLLEFLAKIHFWSAEFLRGFIPFVILLVPYILFSSQVFCERVRSFISRSWFNQLVLPLGILLSYWIASYFTGTFSKDLLFKLFLWLLIPIALLSFRLLKNHSLYPKEIIAALMLWFPIEFGALSGFDIIFTEGIQIPALAFAAPVFGLYLFAIVRDLPDIGYNFRWRLADLGKALLSFLLLAAIVIPLATIVLRFVSLTKFDTSLIDMVKIFLGIYFLVALPEELLFRGIIQNVLTKMLGKWKGGFWLALFIASVIFGYSHYNNNTPPDMRYVFLATLAGLFYGWTYRWTGKTTVSALVHCGVNFTWAILFGGTAG